MNITTLALTARLLLSPIVTDDGVAEADSLGTEGVIDRKLSQSGGYFASSMVLSRFYYATWAQLWLL